MSVMKSLAFAVLVIGIGAAPVSAADKKEAAKAPAADAPAVKKSDSGICHDKSSPSYERTKNFTPFKTMDECIKAAVQHPRTLGQHQRLLLSSKNLRAGSATILQAQAMRKLPSSQALRAWMSV